LLGVFILCYFSASFLSLVERIPQLLPEKENRGDKNFFETWCQSENVFIPPSPLIDGLTKVWVKNTSSSKV